MKLLKTVSSRIEADLIASLLQGHSIPCVVQGDDAAGWEPALALTNGVRIFVNEVDFSDAEKLISP